MDFSPNFVSLIDAIVWPSTVLFIVFKFRNNINELLNRIVNDSQEIEILGVSARFSEAKEKLTSLDLSNTDKETITKTLDDFALSQLKEVSKVFYSGKYSDRQKAALEVAKIGSELRTELLIDLADNGIRGERVAAAIALKGHLLKDARVLSKDGFIGILEKGLGDELSRVRYRFADLVLSNEELTKKYIKILNQMKKEDPNQAVRELVSSLL